VRVEPGFFRALAPSGDGDRADVEARLKLAWPEGSAPSPASPPFPDEVAPDRGWGQILNRLVVNPEGISLYQMASPPLRSGLRPQPIALPAPPGRRLNWARLRVETEGLHRLDVEALARALGRSAIDPSEVRLYYFGARVPVVRSGDGASAETYFWNPAQPSPYTRERVYWATAAPELDPALVPTDPIDAATGEPRRLETTPRLAAVDRDRHRIDRLGVFREILDMVWVDGELLTSPTLELPLTLESFVDGPAEARLDLYFDPEQAERVDLVRGGPTIQLRGGGRLLGETPPVSQAGRSRLNLRLEPGALHDGPSTLSLGLAPGGEFPPVGGLWLDRLEIEYISRIEPAGGRLTIRAGPAHEADGRVNRTPLAFVESTGGEVDPRWVILGVRDGRSGVEGTMSPRDLFPGLSVLSPQVADGEASLIWRGEPGFRIEVYAREAISTAGGFEPADPAGAAALAALPTDLLILTHERFLPELGRLVDLHRRLGLGSRVVDVQEVYDHFNGGELSPAAIRDYLAWTLSAGGARAPGRVLFVGDATSDYRDFSREGVPNWVPSYTVRGGREPWASDEWMGLVAGEDALPDFMIGRISVDRIEDLRAIVEKEITYAGSPRFGPARARLALVADNDLDLPHRLDALAAAHFPKALPVERVYQRDLPLEDNWYADEAYRDMVFARDGEWMKICPLATRRIFDLLTGGTTLLTYFGHGSPNVWSLERMWFGGDHSNSENRHLHDTGPLAFVVNLTCNSGALDYPLRPWNVNIIEDMLRVPGGGAVGTFVPSGPSQPARHEAIAHELFRSVFSDRLRGFGEIVALTKARYLLADQPEDVALMYHLLGDPGLELSIVSDLLRFELPERVYARGQRLRQRLDGLNPREGQWTVSVAEAGRLLWASPPEDYAGGRIHLDVALPEDLPYGPKVLQVYAWSESSGADLAASAEFSLLTPVYELSDFRLARASDGGLSAAAEVSNVGEASGAGARVSIRRWGAEGSPSAEGWSVRLGPGESRTLDWRVEPPADNGDILTYEALLQPELEPWRAEVPRELRRRAVWVPPAVTPRWAAELSGRRWVAQRQVLAVELLAVAGADRPERECVARWIDESGAELTTGTLVLEPQGEFLGGRVGLARVGLPADADEALEGSLELRCAAPGGAGTPITEDRMGLARLAERGPRLRLRPGTVRVDPSTSNPTVGETIFVLAEVENVGDEASATARLRLLEGDPEAGGRPVYNHMREIDHPVEPLGAGRSGTFRLRWDPVRNPGPRRFWVQLLPDASEPWAPAAERLAEGTVRVKTKPDLKYGAVRAGRREDDRRLGRRRIFLTAEVINEGETDARNVTITFYKGEAPLLGESYDEAHVIHRTVVDRIEGLSTRLVVHEWWYESPEELLDKDGRLIFWVQATLEGFRRGILSQSGELEGELDLPGR